MTKLRVKVWSSPDFEDLVADITVGDDVSLAVIDQDDGGPTKMKISFDRDSSQLGRISLDDFENALREAREQLYKLRLNKYP